ncbi:MAG: D-2-hydroxyacid dehydrogenase [Marinilabiliaceae bacterium]|nr:D-2-hydroxyacid dehydrogenase [Marinilabiliaceae bacterium]
MKIVVLDGYTLNPGDLSWENLKTLGEVDVFDRTAPELVLERLNEAEIALTNKTIITAEHISALPKLRYIGVLATGYNVVDLQAAKKAGIVVTNIPAYSTASVAQMVFAHLLNVAQHVDHYASQNRAGRWAQSIDFSYADTPLTELQGKTMGIIGLGNTGMATARIALAFGMNVVAMTSKKELPQGIRSVSRDELFRTSDVVSLHCPLCDDTRHIINAQALSLMKRSAILINCGRGPLVDEDALSRALKNGQIQAACLDVLSSEPPKADNPLLELENCYITPHIAWASKEARERLMTIATNNVRCFISGKPVNVVG